MCQQLKTNTFWSFDYSNVDDETLESVCACVASLGYASNPSICKSESLLGSRSLQSKQETKSNSMALAVVKNFKS